MTNITPISSFNEVPLLEKDDPVEGGLEGASNKQAIALANRTQYLKDQADQVPEKIEDKINELVGTPDPFPQYLSQDKANDLYIKLEGANLPSGAVLLDSTGKIPASFLNFVKTTYKVVADKTARLALPSSDDLQIIVQQDEDRLYYLNGGTNPAVDANWFKGQSATVNGVASVFGRTGSVVAEAGDYNADQITETSNRVFLTPQQKTDFTQKQAKLVSGANIVTLFGKSLLAGGNLSFTPAELGAAAVKHAHETSEVNGLVDLIQNKVNTAFEPGAGVSIGVNPTSSKLMISVNTTTADPNGYAVAERTGSLANQTHDFSFAANTQWALQAFALKRIAGATNQINKYDDFTSGIFTNYDLSALLDKTTAVGSSLASAVTSTSEGTFYKSQVLSLSGLQSFIATSPSATDSIVPALTGFTSAPGYVASASSARNYAGAGSEDAWRAFDGVGNDDWFATGANGQWLRIDLPKAMLVSSYSIKNRPEGSQSLATWYLQGSNDGGSSWTNLHSGSNSSTAANAVVTYQVPAASQGAYLSYRLYVLSSNGGSYSSVSQWKLFSPTGKMALKGSDGNWYVAASGKLSQITAPATASELDSVGFSDTGTVPASQWGSLTSVQLYGSADRPGTFKWIPVPQIATPKGARSLSVFSAITALGATVTQTGGGKTTFAFTKDNKEFFAFKSSAWVSLGMLTNTPASAVTLLNSGNTYAEAIALTKDNFTALFGDNFSKIGVAYGISYSSLTDVADIKALQFTGNLSDSWQYQTPAEVVINRRLDGITFKTVVAGDYKLCYQIPKS